MPLTSGMVSDLRRGAARAIISFRNPCGMEFGLIWDAVLLGWLLLDGIRHFRCERGCMSYVLCHVPAEG